MSYKALVSAVLMVSDALAECLVVAAERYSIHPYLIQAIAWVESRGNPWALNIKTTRKLNLKGIRVQVERKGKYFIYSIYPSSREEAMKVLSLAKDALSIDYGLMQINSFWLRKFNIGPVEALDPCTNIMLGTYIISYCWSKTGMDWRAIECYHSSERIRGPGSYAAKVCETLYGREACQF